MPNGRPGDSRHHDIVHLKIPVFGPSCDALVREITARLPRSRLHEFQDLVEGWPFEPDGRPHDTDALFHRLLAFRDTLDASPEPPPARGSVPATAAPPPPRRGSLLGGLVGAVIGGVIGLPLGFLAYMVAREVALPTDLWSSDGVMWAIILAVAGPAALIGLRQGAAPSRLGHALAVGLLGFLLGSLAFGMVAGIIGAFFAPTSGAGDRAAGFAMGLVFGLMPLAGFLGGLGLALHMGRRAWQRWRG
jgi:hypothetical protein